MTVVTMGSLLWMTQLYGADTGSAPPVDMQEMVVTASRRPVPLLETVDIVQIIDRATIEAIKPSSTGELLEYVTGTSVSRGTGSGLPDRSVIGLNGLPPNYTLVLLNGVPLLTDHIHTGQNIDLIPASNIERIEIVRGAGSSQYGADAIGGIVNIITRTASDRPEGAFRFVAGDYNTRETSLSLLLPIGEQVRLSSFVEWEQSDGLPLKAPAHRIGKTGYERLNLYNRLDAALSDTTDLFIWLNLVHNQMDWRDGTADSTLVTPVVGITHEVTPAVDFATHISYSDWDAEVNGERNQLLKPEAYVTWQLGHSHTLLVGGDYSWGAFSRTAVEAPDQTGYGVFVQDEWFATGEIMLLSALRYDKVDDIDGAISPKLALMFAPSDRWRLRTSLGRGFHAPTLQELYEEGYGHGGSAYRFGNPELEPEYSTTLTAGVEGSPTKSTKVMVNLFYSDLDNMIVPVYEGAWAQDPTIDVWRRENIENAEVYGMDASTSLHVGEHVVVNAGYTYTENEDRDTGRQLPYSPGQSAYGNIFYRDRLTTHVSAEAFISIRAGFGREAWNWKPTTGAAADNPDGLITELGDYTKLDTGVTLRVAEMIDLFVKIENLLGEDIENLDDSYTVLDGEPFVRVGVNYRFPFSK